MNNLTRILVFLIPISTFAASNESILILNDIHFDPYVKCRTIAKVPCDNIQNLIISPINKWDSFLTQKPLGSSISKQETNNTYLKKGLESLKPIADKNKVKVIFLLGDVLSHNFTRDYKYFAPLKYKNQKYLTEFSYKTILYVLQQLKNNLPNTKLYLVLGNNDSDYGDYEIPSKLFLANIAKQLSTYVSNPKTFAHTFDDGGYFSVELNKNTVLIGLNTNILSSKNPNANIATSQLNWLKQELFIAKAMHKHVIIMQHIPYGIDMFMTAMLHISMPILNQNLQKKYLSLLKNNSSIITAIYSAHYHAEYLALVEGIPLIGNLAFNSLFGNTPGFKIININANGYLNDYKTYTDASHNNNKIQWSSLYTFSKAYGNPANIIKILKLFPDNEHSLKVIDYRKYYNGNNLVFHQPISVATKWKYYYCGINNINLLSYKQCLNSFK